MSSENNITFQIGNAPSDEDIKISEMGQNQQIPEALMNDVDTKFSSASEVHRIRSMPSNQPQPQAKPISAKISDNNDFLSRVSEYVKANNPHVSILTPCYGSMCYVNFVHCLMNTISLFKQLNIHVTIEFCKNDSLVSRARNNLVAKSMSNQTVTHIMFIDNDITWDPTDIIKLMLSDKSLIGGVYPLKKYNWEKIVDNNGELVKKIMERKSASSVGGSFSNTDYIQHNLLKYNTNFLDNVITIENNLAKVRHIATGFMMFKRTTIEQMMRAYPATKYTDDVGFLQGDENKYAYALFDCGVEDDHYYSEDWMFCHRWAKMGGNIYMDVSINLTHTGLEDYKGSFIASIL
jgi:hypothetical protein